MTKHNNVRRNAMSIIIFSVLNCSPCSGCVNDVVPHSVIVLFLCDLKIVIYNVHINLFVLLFIICFKGLLIIISCKRTLLSMI